MKKLENFKEMFKYNKMLFKENWQVFKDNGKKCIKEFKNKETRYKQIPNAFTASRLFAPIFIIPAALFGNLILTGIFTCLFAFTDFCDGHFARKYNVQSEFGRELDPITDKLFAGALLMPLIILNPVMIISLIFEAIIASINMHSRLNNNKPVTAIIGKIKTGSLSITIILSYMSMIIAVNPTIINVLIGITSTLQLATAIKYYKIYKVAEIAKINNTVINININDEEKDNDEKVDLYSKEIFTSKEATVELSRTEKIDALYNLEDELVNSEKPIIPDIKKVYGIEKRIF